MIRLVIAHPYLLFRQGLCSLFTSTEDILIVGEADEQEQMLQLVHQHCPDVVLCDVRLFLSPSNQAPLSILVAHVRQAGVRGIFLLAPSDRPLKEEALFQFLKYGVNAYEAPTVSGEDLAEKIRQVARGESLLTSALLSPEVAAAYGQGGWSDEASQREQGPVEDIPGEQVQKRAAFGLSEREVDVLREVMRGHSNKEIAKILQISDQTVKNHITSVLKKTGRADRTAAVVLALRLKLLSLEEANLVGAKGSARKNG